MSITQLQVDADNLAIKNLDSHAVVGQLYIATNINPYFICSGYSTQEALENAYNQIDIFDKSYSFEEYLDDITIISASKI